MFQFIGATVAVFMTALLFGSLGEVPWPDQQAQQQSAAAQVPISVQG